MNFKKTYLLIILLLSFECSFSSNINNKEFGFKINNQYDVCLDFNEHNTYNLFFIYDIEGIGYHLIISSGTFTLKNNLLLLKDISKQFTLKFKSQYDQSNKFICLYAINGYKWMKNQCFYYLDSNRYYDICIDKSIYNTNKNIPSVKSKCYEIKTGKTYTYTQNGFKYTLNFIFPDKYIYKFMEFTLSEGKYKQQNNLIDLFDESFTAHFKAYISNKSVAITHLPVGSRFLFVEQ